MKIEIKTFAILLFAALVLAVALFIGGHLYLIDQKVEQPGVFQAPLNWLGTGIALVLSTATGWFLRHLRGDAPQATAGGAPFDPPSPESTQ